MRTQRYAYIKCETWAKSKDIDEIKPADRLFWFGFEQFCWLTNTVYVI